MNVLYMSQDMLDQNLVRQHFVEAKNRTQLELKAFYNVNV